MGLSSVGLGVEVAVGSGVDVGFAASVGGDVGSDVLVGIAVSVGRGVDVAGVDVLEAPLRPNHISGYRELKAQGALPILMDEGVISPTDLIEFIKLDMLDGVAQKPARCGGLVSCRRQIEILLDAGLMWLGSGLTDPDISLAATLALYGAYGLDAPAALNGPQFLAESVLAERLQPAEGMLACGYEGKGRLAEPDDIVARAGEVLGTAK